MPVWVNRRLCSAFRRRLDYLHHRKVRAGPEVASCAYYVLNSPRLSELAREIAQQPSGPRLFADEACRVRHLRAVDPEAVKAERGRG
jgi:hypothetical protein